MLLNAGPNVCVVRPLFLCHQISCSVLYTLSLDMSFLNYFMKVFFYYTIPKKIHLKFLSLKKIQPIKKAIKKKINIFAKQTFFSCHKSLVESQTLADALSQ